MLIYRLTDDQLRHWHDNDRVICNRGQKPPGQKSGLLAWSANAARAKNNRGVDDQ